MRAATRREMGAIVMDGYELLGGGGGEEAFFGDGEGGGGTC